MDWFAQKLITWHAEAGRTDLPWQQNINPYRVWVSEIMLQQTQVTTVIDYFLRFMQRFPTVQDLATAPLDEVLHHWTGLGYYARARNLHKSAQIISQQYDGQFPTQQTELEALPGIGRSTAGAIRAISMGQHAAILDGNVKRVLARYHALPGYPGTTANLKTLWGYAEKHTPATATATYTQAIMDLGATVCTRKKPSCHACPVEQHCEAREQNATDHYPEPKPKKDKPVRRARFFVTSLDNGMTLLERRPADGLWGGLWNPPERAADYQLTDWQRELGLNEGQVSRTHQAPDFRHTFTHFHLDIEPFFVFLHSPGHTVEETDDRRWVAHRELTRSNNPIGLSAVAVKLLAALQEPFDHD